VNAALDFFGNLSHTQLAWLAFGFLVEGCFIAILPEEIVFVSMGYFCRQGRVGWLEALVACQTGVLIANAAMMGAGKLIGSRLALIPPFRWFMSQASLERALELVDRNGWKILFVTRFTPVVRGPIYLAAGLSKLPLKQCIAVDAFASCFQVPLLLMAGYYAFERALAMLRESRVPMAIAGAAVLTFLLVRQARRRGREAALGR
jgi:membrane protein DedA with SNARE-associated domain